MSRMADPYGALRLLTAFAVSFAATVLTVTAAQHQLPAWVKVAFALPGMVARSLGG
jgi:hypothetical protein